MTEDVNSFLQTLEQYEPLTSYKFGHTPVQMAYFKTSSHQGSDVFEYWHQVLQLKALKESLEDLTVQRDEALAELDDAKKVWPFWTYSKRKRSIPKVSLKIKRLKNAIDEKLREADFHYNLLKSKYSDFEKLTETEILSQDKEYWSYRLGKQLATSRLSRTLGVGEGELSAVLSLPLEERQKVLEGMTHFLKDSQLLLTQS